MTFDPFNDFESRGYLRNNAALRDPIAVKEYEHRAFLAKLEQAFQNLAPIGRENGKLTDYRRTRTLNALTLALKGLECARRRERGDQTTSGIQFRTRLDQRRATPRFPNDGKVLPAHGKIRKQEERLVAAIEV